MKAESFGYKNAWFAFRSSSASAVAAALQLEGASPASWKEGVGASYGADRSSPNVGDVFVTPPIDGWVLAVGRALWTLNDSQPPRVTEWCAKLSQALGGAEVQYFSTYRVVDAHAWGRAKNGIATRSYIVVQDEVREDFGDQSEEEKQLGFKFFDFGSVDSRNEDCADREDLEMPGEEHVMQLAAVWSVDPSVLEERSLEMEAGIVGRIALPEPNYPTEAERATPIVEPKEVETVEAKNPALAGAVDERRRPWWRFW